jgi:hypothetical protein
MWYVIFCLLAGVAGSYRRMGFFGTFFLSLLLTPLLVLLLLILTRSRDPRDRYPQNVVAPFQSPDDLSEHHAADTRKPRRSGA